MSKVNIDAIDRKILKFLIANARMPFLEIARECGISGAAIHQRVKKLDDMGVITGSRLEVDPKSLGYDVCAFIGIRLSEPALNAEIVGFLKKIPEITECYFTTGQFNILVKIYCTNNEHLMETIFNKLLKFRGISGTETFIALNEAFTRQANLDNIE